MYHDGAAMGAHAGREDTLAKIGQVAWFPGMSHLVRQWVGTCAVCKMHRPQPTLSVDERTSLYDRPFRVIIIDAVGPISPKDTYCGRKCEWLLHALCPFSQYTWLHASPSDDSDEWARFLVEEVFFDLAGFPAVLKSDRGAAFTGAVIKSVNGLLGITHAFGTAYHPQSQGAIEGTHPRINTILSTYCERHGYSWARFSKLAQWALRATPRAELGHRSPYEVITGLRPQGPMDALLARMSAKTLSAADYVSDLRRHITDLHREVQISVVAEAEARAAAKQSKHLPDAEPAIGVGSYVFLRRPPTIQAKTDGEDDEERVNVSRRLLPRAHAHLYMVKKVLSDQVVVLCDPHTHSEDLGFAQPVHMARLIPFTLCGLEGALPERSAPRLEIVSRDGSSHAGTLVAQTATGLVRVQWDAGGETELLDLGGLEYRWLPEGPAPA